MQNAKNSQHTFQTRSSWSQTLTNANEHTTHRQTQRHSTSNIYGIYRYYTIHFILCTLYYHSKNCPPCATLKRPEKWTRKRDGDSVFFTVVVVVRPVADVRTFRTRFAVDWAHILLVCLRMPPSSLSKCYVCVCVLFSECNKRAYILHFTFLYSLDRCAHRQCITYSRPPQSWTRSCFPHTKLADCNRHHTPCTRCVRARMHCVCVCVPSTVSPINNNGLTMVEKWALSLELSGRRHHHHNHTTTTTDEDNTTHPRLPFVAPRITVDGRARARCTRSTVVLCVCVCYPDGWVRPSLVFMRTRARHAWCRCARQPFSGCKARTRATDRMPLIGHDRKQQGAYICENLYYIGLLLLVQCVNVWVCVCEYLKYIIHV